jgi:hypothetical protein
MTNQELHQTTKALIEGTSTNRIAEWYAKKYPRATNPKKTTWVDVWRTLLRRLCRD